MTAIAVDRQSSRRLLAITCTGIYTASLWYIYVYLLRDWAYLGCELGDTPRDLLLTTFLLCVLPSCYLDTDCNKATSYHIWFIYYFTYIPSALIPALQYFNVPLYAFEFVLAASFYLICKLQYKPKFKRLGAGISKQAFWTTFWVIYCYLILYLLEIFGGTLRLVDLAAIYEQRAVGGNAAFGNLGGHAVGLLSNVFNPFLMTVGCLHKRYCYIYIGIVCQVYVFATMAAKAVILNLFVTLLICYLCTNNKKIQWRSYLYFISGIIVLPLVYYSFADNINDPISNAISTLIFMRSFGIVGAMTGQFMMFFAQHPHTWYSHVHFVDIFIKYPYREQLGMVVGETLNAPELDANANFFATDGIAAAGILGLPIIGIVMGLFFRTVDYLFENKNATIFACASCGTLTSLVNASFFTTLITGGLAVLIFICYVFREDMIS